MRAVVQRVTAARIEVDGKTVSEIGHGLLVLVGLLDSDTDFPEDSQHASLSEREDRQTMGPERELLDFLARSLSGVGFVGSILGSHEGHEVATGFMSGCIRSVRPATVMQKDYEVLLVSQFTLYGVLKGNKPDFHVAMPPQLAEPFYESLVQRVRRAYKPDAVKDGVFGAMMQVHLVNDGPVTMNLDSRKVSSPESGISVPVLPFNFLLKHCVSRKLEICQEVKSSCKRCCPEPGKDRLSEGTTSNAIPQSSSCWC